jgi:transposase
MPPWLRDWLAKEPSAWLVIGAVGRLDLRAFYAACRAHGLGRAEYEPSMMVSLVLYVYSTDERSSRGARAALSSGHHVPGDHRHQVPDHATITRSIRRRQQSFNELLGAVLRLCARAGVVSSGVEAVDGTKLTASPSSDSTWTTTDRAGDHR